jgi:hypothetical protein
MLLTYAGEEMYLHTLRNYRRKERCRLYSDVEYLPDVFLFIINIVVTSVSSFMNNQIAQTNQDKQSNIKKTFIHTYLYILIYI